MKKTVALFLAFALGLFFAMTSVPMVSSASQAEEEQLQLPENQAMEDEYKYDVEENLSTDEEGDDELKYQEEESDKETKSEDEESARRK